MILIRNLPNSIGGTERQTQMLGEYLRQRSILSKIRYTPRWIRRLGVFQFWADALLLWWQAVVFRSRVVYIMTRVAPSTWVQVFTITYPYLLVGLFLTIINKEFVIRLVSPGNFEKLQLVCPLWTLRRFTYFANTKAEREYIARNFPEINAFLTINGVDYRCFKRISTLRKPPTLFRFGYIGRFAPVKNLLMLIEAFALLPPEILKQSTLELVGMELACCKKCDAYNGAVKKKIRECNLANKVQLTPALPMGSASLVEKYNSLNVFVYPSWEDGSANSVLESLACNVPVIVWKGAIGPAELVDQKSGWVVDDLTSMGLAQMMAQSYQAITSGSFRNESRKRILRYFRSEKSLSLSTRYLVERNY